MLMNGVDKEANPVSLGLCLWTHHLWTYVRGGRP